MYFLLQTSIKWLSVLLLLVLLTKIRGQNSRSYDTSDWIPITKSCPTCYEEEDEQEHPVVQKKPTGRVLNLPESPNQRKFFPQEDQLKKQPQKEPVQQYLRETTQENVAQQRPVPEEDYRTYTKNEEYQPNHQKPPAYNRQEQEPAAPQQKQSDRYVLVPQQQHQPQVESPDISQQLLLRQQQELLAAQLLNEHYKNQDQLRNTKPHRQSTPPPVYKDSLDNVQRYRPVIDSLYPKTISNIESAAATVINPQLISITTATPREKDEKEVVQLLYVPMENLQPQREVPNLNYQPQNPYRAAEGLETQYSNRPQPEEPNGRRQQQLQKRIQEDFIRQALEAQRLQAQLQQGDVPVAYTTTPTPKPLNRKRKPHQPPLALFMGADHKVHISDVLNELKNADTIAVQDSVGPGTPKVFVGPSTLDVPEGYAKFDLPYLSSIENNRIQRKVDTLPFFVAPLTYKAPAGYSKIPLPSPHVGSVVVSTKDAANTISSTPKPTNNRPTENTNTYLYQQYVPRHTTSKPLPQKATEYTKYDLYQHPEEADSLFENQASRRQPVSLTIRNRQPTTSTESSPAEEIPHRRPSVNYYDKHSDDERLTTTVRQPGRYDQSNYHEDISERPIQHEVNHPTQATQPRRQPTTPDAVYNRNEVPRVRQHPTKHAYQEPPTVVQQFRPKEHVEHSHVDDTPIKQHPIKQSEYEEVSQPKRQPSKPLNEERETYFSRREPARNHGADEEVSKVNQQPIKQSIYQGSDKPEPSVFSFKQPDEPRLGYEEEILSSRGPLIIPNFYRKPSYEEYIPYFHHHDDEDDDYYHRDVNPAKKPSKTNYEKPDATSHSSKQKTYETTTHRDKQPSYVRTSTTPAEYSRDNEDTRTTFNNYYSSTTERIPTVTHSNLEQPKYTTLEQFSVNQKSSTPAYTEENNYSEKPYHGQGLSAYRTTNEHDLKNKEPHRNPPQNSDIENLRQDSPSKTRQHSNIVSEVKHKQPSSNAEHAEDQNEESDDENYNLPAQLPPINPILPGLINNLQDESVRPLLVPGLLVPTTESHINRHEHYTEKEAVPVVVTTTTQIPVIETTTHYNRRGVRNRHRVATRYTTPSTTSHDAAAEVPTRRSNQRGRRPVSRTRQENVRHFAENDETSTSTEYSPVRANEYTTESPRRHITHSPRQRFRTRARPVHRDENQETPKQSVEEKLPSVQAPPRSYPQYEPSEDSAHPRVTQRYPEAITTTENVIKEPTTHEPVTEAPRKPWLDDFSYSASVESAQALRNQPEAVTQRPTPRQRSRTRGRPRHSTTTTTVPPPTTTRRYTTTTDKPKEKAEEEEEFYGFIRPPSFNKPVQLHFDYSTKPPSSPKEHVQQYTPRPEYVPKTTALPVYQVEYTPKTVPDLSYYSPNVVSSTQQPKIQYYELVGEADKSGIKIYTNGDDVSTTPRQLFIPQYTVDQQHLAATPEPVRHVQPTTIPEEHTTKSKVRFRVPQRKRPSEGTNSAENYDYDRSGEESQAKTNEVSTTKHAMLPISPTDSFNYKGNEVSDSYGQPITRRTNLQRTRNRGSAHFQRPANLRPVPDEDSIEGANYPSTYLQSKGATTQAPSFQITVDPEEAAESAYDQLPYSSIQRPSIVRPDNVVESLDSKISTTEESITDGVIVETTTENEGYEVVEEAAAEETSEIEKPKTEESITADETATTTIPSVTTTTAPRRIKNRRKGVWRLVKQRPVDHFETAESQNYPIAIANGISTFDKSSGFYPTYLKPDPSFAFTTSTTTTTTDSTLLGAIYQMFGISQGQTNTTTEKLEPTTTEQQAEVTTEVPHQLSEEAATTTDIPVQQTTQDQSQSFERTTTEIPIRETTLENAETTSLAPTEIPTTEKMTSTTPQTEQKKHYLVGPWEMRAVKTLTSTEVSHQTEICYKGRCVKSTSSQAP